MLPMRYIPDELMVSKAITVSFVKDFLTTMMVDATIDSAGPASMVTNAVCSTPGMRPILLSEKRATEVTLETMQ